MDVHGCTKSCEDVNCSLAVCAACCSRCDERKEENRGSVWMKRSLLSVVNEASVWLFWSLCLEGEGTHFGETHSGTLLRWYNALIISVLYRILKKV